MKSCDTCKWDRGRKDIDENPVCLQGHYRWNDEPIQDCHAWQEKVKEKCWCDEVTVLVGLGSVVMGHLAPMNFCPQCGKKLEEGK